MIESNSVFNVSPICTIITVVAFSRPIVDTETETETETKQSNLTPKSTLILHAVPGRRLL